MEKIILNSHSFEIKNSGIRLAGDRLSVNLVNVSSTLDEIETIFNNSENIAKISLVSESDETLRIFNGFNKLVEINKEKDVVIGTELVDEVETEITSDVITVVLDKVSNTEERLVALEETVDLLVMENLGL